MLSLVSWLEPTNTAGQRAGAGYIMQLIASETSHQMICSRNSLDDVFCVWSLFCRCSSKLTGSPLVFPKDIGQLRKARCLPEIGKVPLYFT